MRFCFLNARIRAIRYRFRVSISTKAQRIVLNFVIHAANALICRPAKPASVVKQRNASLRNVMQLCIQAKLLECPPLPERRIEVYGDSVSAGEVSEALEYTGKQDPQHNGEYSNSYYSYAWLTACNLPPYNHLGCCHSARLQPQRHPAYRAKNPIASALAGGGRKGVRRKESEAETSDSFLF